MSTRLRENAAWLALAATASAGVAWAELVGFAWNGYEVEALPAVQALVHGHLHAFFARAPVYGGSLLERAPFALLPGLWGGGDLAVYRMLALPCLLATLLLGVWLVDALRARRATLLTRAAVLGLCVGNPLTFAALELGHPEELLAGALCVSAVLLAVRERPVWAGLALGAAIANKQWALLALGPVLIALPSRRLLATAAAGALSGALIAPFFLLAPATFGAAAHAAATPGSTIFQPWQLWWFFGHHGHVVHDLFGNVKPGYRTAQAWVGTVSHPLIMALGVPLTLAAWRRSQGRVPLTLAAWRRLPGRAPIMTPVDRGTHLAHRRLGVQSRDREAQALALLALLLLMRCMLDTWDIVYYALPFVLALAAWESLSAGRVPVLALASAVAAFGEWRWLPRYVSADGGALFFACWSLPLALGLARALYRAPRPGSVRADPEPAAACPAPSAELSVAT